MTSLASPTARQLYTDVASIAGDELRGHTAADLHAAAELAVAAGDAKAAARLAYYAGMAQVLQDTRFAVVPIPAAGHSIRVFDDGSYYIMGHAAA